MQNVRRERTNKKVPLREKFTSEQIEAGYKRFTFSSRDGEGGCLLWTSSCNGTGYPQATIANRHVMVREVIFTHLHQHVKRGYRLTSTCLNKRCIAPDHLIQKTAKQICVDNWKTGVSANTPHRLRNVMRANRRRAKTTMEMARELRRRAADRGDTPIYVLCDEMGVSRSFGYDIVAGRALREEIDPRASVFTMGLR